ncbi:MAG: GIY-YIG nuclease family protein [Bacteroidota bacterium]
MFTYYVYILRCKDDSYYTGITNNLVERFQQHQSGHNRNSYTFKRRPVVLEYCKEFDDVIEAINFEKRLKGWSRAKKQALIRKDFDKLQVFSECRNVSHHKYRPQ